MNEPTHDPLAQLDAVVLADLSQQRAAGERRPRRRPWVVAIGMSTAVLVASFSWLGLRNDSPRAEGGDKKQTFTDVAGKVQTPLFQPDKKATVLFFLLPECPISNAYAPEIERITSAYAAKGFAAFIVHADPDVTADQARKHAQAYRFTCPVLLDPTHVLVKKAGVTMAPEVAVLSADGSIRYRGRIDNWYVDYGKRRGQPTQRDLRHALDALVEGRAVPTPVTQPIGCYLPEPRK